MDASGERGRGGQARRGVRAPRRPVAARAGAARTTTAWSRGEELVGLDYVGPFDDLPAAGRDRPPRDPVGRGRRSTRGRGSSTSRRARAPRTSSSRAIHDLPTCSSRSTSRAGCCPASACSRGSRRTRSRTSIDRGPARAASCSSSRAGSRTATRSAGAARRRSSSASSTTGSSPATEIRQPTARRERDRRVDARLLLEADGRLAAQHGRLEHLAEALLRPAAALLPVRDCGELNVIGSRAELEERATGGLDELQELHRPWIDEVTISCDGVRQGRAADPRGRRRLARRGHRPVLDARLEEPGVDRARLRDGRGRRACPERTCPTTRTGSSGSPRTGSRRCASRSGSGSTRCSSCR